MEISRLSCRLCLSVTDFNVSLFGNYCQKTNMLDKVLVCLKLVVEETDVLQTICYKCADTVERFYDFIVFVKKTQMKLNCNERYDQGLNEDPPNGTNRRHITTYVREQVFDADYTFSFLDNMSHNDEKSENKASSPFFSYFSQPNAVLKKSEPRTWKAPLPRSDIQKSERKSHFEKQTKLERQNKVGWPRQLSRDLFDSPSQDAEEADTRCLDWKLTPDESIIRRVREKCFGPSDF